MISVSRLSKHYGPTRSVEDVSFDVGEGEILGFLGPNGAGKSTTMRVLTGLARPTSGTATIAGFDVQRNHERIRPILGYLPEGAPMYGDMTLGAYLEFMAGIKGLGRADARREMERTTALVNLQKERPRLLRNLSKGTRQRAAFAQALLGRPKVLILDEPTSGLDPAQINDVRALIKSLAGQCTVVLSTHILPEVEMTCGRIVIIQAGRVVARGTPAELIESLGTRLAMQVRGDRAAFDRIVREFGGDGCSPAGDAWEARISSRDAQGQRAELARRIVEAGLDLLELKIERPSLEEIFLRSLEKPAA